MKLLVQVGKLGDTIIDHLLSPIAKVNGVEEVCVFCKDPGPVTEGLVYHCPPSVFGRFTITAALYEYASLFLHCFSPKYQYVAGYLLWPHGLIAFIIGKLFRKKVIISMIAGIPELYTKKSIEGLDFNNPPPWFGKMYLSLLRKADIVITTGSVTKQYLVRHGVDGNKIHAIIHPANNKKYFPVDASKQWDVISVAYLEEIKHTEILLYAIEQVKQVKSEIKACVVGSGVRMEYLTNLARELGIDENVEFVGYQKDVPYFLNRSRIFLHSSEREGFPNVFLEAMLCGLPGIVSNCGDIIDLARDGVNSIVVQNFRDYQSFSEAITRLLDDHDLYNEMSKNALLTMKNLTEENVVNTWQKVLVS